LSSGHFSTPASTLSNFSKGRAGPSCRASQASQQHFGGLKGLSDQLPQVVDRLTPDGRLPTAEEMQRRV
jgi:hypothetical protein